MNCNSLVIVLILFQLEHFACHGDHHGHEHEHNDGHLKYLPEFNIEPDKYAKWSKYYQQIQQHYIEHYHHQLDNYEVDNATSCELFTPLVDIEISYYEDQFGRHFLTKEKMEQMNERAQQQSVVHYQIVDHQVYREQKCLFPSRCDGVEHFLKMVAKDLPNMDLYINVHDYPQAPRFLPKERQFPFFSFSRLVSEYADLTYPAWAFWSGGPALDIYPQGIGRWDIGRKSLLQKAKETPWQTKNKVAFFRGSRTSAERDPIILLSRERPELIEAKYTRNQAWRSKADTLGEDPAPTVSFEGHCNYRYLVNAHGVAASFRLKHLFLCGSLVLDIKSDWIEFYYPALIPWVHFVPLAKDFSDAADVIEFLHENNQLAERIARRGFELVRDHLTLDSVECYWRHLLRSYSDRLVSHRPARVDDDLIKV